MLHDMKKVLSLAVGIILIGIGAFLFLTRAPQEPPNTTIDTQVSQNAQEIIPTESTQTSTETPSETTNLQQPKTPESDVIKEDKAPQAEQKLAQKAPDSQKAPVQPQVEQARVIHFAIDKNTSEASFTIDEILRGSPFTVVGTTHEVNGSIDIDFSDPSKTKIGTIIINAQTFRTDSSNRDGAIKRFILHSEDAGKESVIFTPTAITGLPKVFAAGIPLNMTITGNLTIAGITKPATFTASNVLVSSDTVSGEATATIKRSDYGLEIPNIPFVASVPDTFQITMRLTAIKN